MVDPETVYMLYRKNLATAAAESKQQTNIVTVTMFISLKLEASHPLCQWWQGQTQIENKQHQNRQN